MKGYAYLDSVGILHAVTTEKVALEYARNKKIVETEYCGGTGYMKENEYNIIIYSDEKKFCYGKGSAKENVIKEEEFAKMFPNTYEVYKKLI